MRQTLTIVSVRGSGRYVGVNKLGSRFNLDYASPLFKGQTVLVKNGIVIGVVQTKDLKVYEV